MGKNKDLKLLLALRGGDDRFRSAIAVAKKLSVWRWSVLGLFACLDGYLWLSNNPFSRMMLGVLGGGILGLILATRNAVKNWPVVKKYLDWELIEKKLREYESRPVNNSN